ncbi:MAG: trypsin-like peptidase domain-containing protein [Candidatus Paceibacterota bacterium]
MRIKNQKGFIQIPILIAIIAGVLVLGGGGYFSIKQYQKYQAEKIEKEKIAQETQRLKDLEVEKLRQEVEVLKNQKPQIIQKTIIKEAQTPKNDLPDIIRQWKNKIAYVECNFGSNIQSGSGILSTFGYGDNAIVSIITNRHVVFEDFIYRPDFCRIVIPNYNKIISVAIENIAFSSQGYDWATLKINSPDKYLDNIGGDYQVCNTQLSLGESVVILGYPGIGTETGITATEGIISGYEGDYYVTSAKIEYGNSGGAAIFPKGNCYVGIPTFAKIGKVESLARILRAQIIFPGLSN